MANFDPLKCDYACNTKSYDIVPPTDYHLEALARKIKAQGSVWNIKNKNNGTIAS